MDLALGRRIRGLPAPEVRAFLARPTAAMFQVRTPRAPTSWRGRRSSSPRATLHALSRVSTVALAQAAPDILGSRIIAEEFNAARAGPARRPGRFHARADFLLEVGNEDQKRTWIGPTLAGEVIWCQGYSEAGVRLRPRLAADPRRRRRQGLHHQRAEDLDVDGGSGGHDLLPRAHRAAGREARRDQLSDLLHEDSGDRGAAPHHHDDGFTPGMFNEVFFTDVRTSQRARSSASAAKAQRVANTTLKHEQGMLRRSQAPAEGRLAAVVELMSEEDGRRAATDRPDPVMLDRLMLACEGRYWP